MSVTKLVNIREAISQLVDETSEDYIHMMPVLVRWAKQADMRIGSYYSFKKNYYLRTVANKQVPLPLSTVHVNGVVMGDYLNWCPDIFNNLSAIVRRSTMMVDDVNYTFKWDDTTNHGIFTKFNWEVQDNNIVFPGSFANDQQVTIATLNYQEDVDGFPMIIEGHVQAVTSYLKIKLAKKHQWNTFMTNKLTHIDRGFINDLEREYSFEVRQAVSNDAEWTDQDIETMSDLIGTTYCGYKGLNLY